MASPIPSKSVFPVFPTFPRIFRRATLDLSHGRHCPQQHSARPTGTTGTTGVGSCTACRSAGGGIHWFRARTPRTPRTVPKRPSTHTVSCRCQVSTAKREHVVLTAPNWKRRGHIHLQWDMVQMLVEHMESLWETKETWDVLISGQKLHALSDSIAMGTGRMKYLSEVYLKCQVFPQ